ncbi:YicC/YloC family endoribonuclease [Roseivivax isoporae]|uniref:YicC family protein n=1 Tax=Roseivivax isoporae LMG 25204 TaxID=1449351 RepID=X7FBY7_9RHOB|nr:YicC/YloC family endoribonuclease [Roseivivax isoporae]ETX29529.1 hypothetical protein RISW2_23620 [Roseivivax isoporae LMG 25204]
MRQSMTGFASGQGSDAGFRWAWEMRGVNGKGFDLRMRLPDWVEGLDPLLRALVQERVARGSVTVNLRVQADDAEAAPVLSDRNLDRILKALSRVEAEATVQGVTLAPSSAADILCMRGVMEIAQEPTDVEALRTVLVADFERILSEFVAMRQEEGRALDTMLGAHLTEIEALVRDAEAAAAARSDEARARLAQQLARVVETVDSIDEARIAQELALIAVKADVTEEIDRLRVHVDAARALLAGSGPIGRKLDFLMQEFNREANTLCSKAGSAPLTQIGLALKAVIDRMREQVQNVE